MSALLRLVLLISAVLVMLLIAHRLKKSQIQVMDSIFWLLFSLSFVILSLFPRIASFLANALGFQAASNFVFLYVIAILVLRDFTMTVKYAHLRDKLDQLVQELALKEGPYRDE